MFIHKTMKRAHCPIFGLLQWLSSTRDHEALHGLPSDSIPSSSFSTFLLIHYHLHTCFLKFWTQKVLSLGPSTYYSLCQKLFLHSLLILRYQLKFPFSKSFNNQAIQEDSFTLYHFLPLCFLFSSFTSKSKWLLISSVNVCVCVCISLSLSLERTAPVFYIIFPLHSTPSVGT